MKLRSIIKVILSLALASATTAYAGQRQQERQAPQKQNDAPQRQNDAPASIRNDAPPAPSVDVNNVINRASDVNAMAEQARAQQQADQQARAQQQADQQARAQQQADQQARAQQQADQQARAQQQADQQARAQQQANTNRPVVNRPVVNRPTQPIINKPIANQPIKPVVNKPVTNQTNQPVVNKPVVNQPTLTTPGKVVATVPQAKSLTGKTFQKQTLSNNDVVKTLPRAADGSQTRLTIQHNGSVSKETVDAQGNKTTIKASGINPVTKKQNITKITVNKATGTVTQINPNGMKIETRKLVRNGKPVLQIDRHQKDGSILRSERIARVDEQGRRGYRVTKTVIINNTVVVNRTRYFDYYAYGPYGWPVYSLNWGLFGPYFSGPIYPYYWQPWAYNYYYAWAGPVWPAWYGSYYSAWWAPRPFYTRQVYVGITLLGPSLWLADYMMWNYIQSDYQARLEQQNIENAELQQAQTDLANTEAELAESQAELNETQQQLNSEQNQLALNEAQKDQLAVQIQDDMETLSRSTPSEVQSVTLDDTLRDPKRLYVIGEDGIEVHSASGDSCDLTQGDVISVTDPMGNQPVAGIAIQSTKSTDCDVNMTYNISKQDIQDMLNQMTQNLNDGMKSLNANKGALTVKNP